MRSTSKSSIWLSQRSPEVVSSSFKDLKKLGGLEDTTEPCVWTFRNTKGEIIGLVLMYVDDALIACAPTKEGGDLLKKIRGLYE